MLLMRERSCRSGGRIAGNADKTVCRLSVYWGLDYQFVMGLDCPCSPTWGSVRRSRRHHDCHQVDALLLETTMLALRLLLKPQWYLGCPLFRVAHLGLPRFQCVPSISES